MKCYICEVIYENIRKQRVWSHFDSISKIWKKKKYFFLQAWKQRNKSSKDVHNNFGELYILMANTAVQLHFNKIMSCILL